MPQPRFLTHRGAYLLGLSLLVGLTLPVSGYSQEGSQDKTEAARVAKKVEKARNRSARKQAKEDVEALAKFQKELNRYAGLHDDLTARRSAEGALTAGDLARALAAARAKARPGDIFVREVQPLFKRLIADQLQGPDTRDARAAVAEDNPAKDKDVVVVVRVNAPYPSGAARSTVPPSLLLSLPALPDCLHYRFVGRDLILIDAVAQIIVDFLPGAVPATSTSRPR